MLRQVSQMPEAQRADLQAAVGDWYKAELAGQNARPPAPREPKATGLSPAQRLSHSRMILRDLQDKLEELQAFRAMVSSDPRQAKALGKSAFDIDDEIAPIQAKIDAEQAKIDKLLGDDPIAVVTE
jgi:hypothetical protein